MVFRTLSRRFLLGTLGMVAMGLAATSSGCQAISNETAIQCTSEAECLRLGPDFADSTCDKVTKTCIKLTPTEGLCEKNVECLERIGGPAVCRKSDHKCVGLLTPECPDMLAQPGALANDNVVVIGALSPNGTGDIGKTTVRVMDLALADVAFAGNMPGVDGGPTRPVAAVGCREFGAGIDGLLRGVNHLVNNVKVPVIVGPINPGHAAISATQVTLRNKVLLIAPTSISAGLANLPNPIAPTPLIWRLNYSDTSVARVIGKFIEQVLEPYLKSKNGSAPIKVVVIQEENLIGVSGGAALQKVLFFNGKDAAGNATADPPALAITNMGDPSNPLTTPNPDAKYAAVIQQVYQFQPDVIIWATADVAMVRVTFPMEINWPAGVKRPLHIGVLPPWNGGVYPPLLNFIDAVPERRARFFAVNAYTDTDQASVASWLLRFRGVPINADLQNSFAPTLRVPQLFYDGMMTAVHAMVALGNRPITGENLASTLPRLTSGKELLYAPENVGEAFGVLQTGQSINVRALTGNIDWDPATAAPDYPLEITCRTNPVGLLVDFARSNYNGTDPSKFTCPLPP